MEAERSLPCTQQPFTGACRQTDHSTPHHPTVLLQCTFQYYPPIHAYSLQAVPFILPPYSLPSFYRVRHILSPHYPLLFDHRYDIRRGIQLIHFFLY